MSLDSKDKIEAFLPPVELLRKYEELNMGSDLIELVKKEQEHRQYLQAQYLKYFKYGQLFGFLLSIFIFHGIFALIKNGNLIGAYIVLGVFAVLFLSVIFMIKSNNNNNKQHKINLGRKQFKPKLKYNNKKR